MKKRNLVIGMMVMAMTLTGCKAAASNDAVTTSGTTPGETAGSETSEESLPELNTLKLGEDYTDLKADLRFITHRTDSVDTTFAGYIEEFRKLYPNITISYEGITNYAEDMTLRLTTDNWGDICMIPTSVMKTDLPNKFMSYGKTENLAKDYIMVNKYSYKGEVYGIPSVGNAQGIVYNKKVFEDAGITELPKTPDEFLEALQKIKNNTEAIPLYSNFAAGWTMTAWDAYVRGSSTGDPDFVNSGLTHGENPFQKHEDMTGPYAVYYTLYESVARGLTEDDPTTTDWEGSKGMLNSGKIGCMVLGSWAIVQMQEAGENPDNIGYMPFPITVNGKQYSTAGPDFNYAININSSRDNQLAAMLYVKWLTEESNFAYDEGGIPIPQGAEYPETLKAFDGIELITDNDTREGEEDLYDNINNGSEVGLSVSKEPKQAIVEAAITGEKTLDEIMEEWNEKWTKAQLDNGVTPEPYDYVAAIADK